MIEHKYSYDTRPNGYMIYTGWADDLFAFLASEGFKYVGVMRNDETRIYDTAIVLLDCGLEMSVRLIKTWTGHFQEASVRVWRGNAKVFGEDVINNGMRAYHFPSEQEDLRVEFLAKANDALDEYVNKNHFERVSRWLHNWASPKK